MSVSVKDYDNEGQVFCLHGLNRIIQNNSRSHRKMRRKVRLHAEMIVKFSITSVVALSTVFHSINSPDNSLFSHSVLQVLPLPFNFISLHESLLQP